MQATLRKYFPRLLFSAMILTCLLTASCNEDLEQVKNQLDSVAKPTIDAFLKNTELLWHALEKSLEAKEFWQLIATVEAILIPVVFFWGIGLGSSAKRDALSLRQQRSQRYELE